MRVSDVKPAKLDGIWIYELRSDKTDWRRDVGQAKRVVLGPRAYETIRPYLEAKDAEAFVFSPKDAFRARSKTPRGDVGDSYDSNSYRHAVQRAAERAGVPKWTPNQLRHLYATEIREKYGLEAAQLMLGHSRADVTQIYAERDFKRALEVAAKEG